MFFDAAHAHTAVAIQLRTLRQKRLQRRTGRQGGARVYIGDLYRNFTGYAPGLCAYKSSRRIADFSMILRSACPNRESKKRKH